MSKGSGITATDSAAGGGAVTISEAARRAGLTSKAIRLYEARGLLPPVTRTEAGYRVYTEHDLRALRFIRQARAVGLSLEEIHTIMALRRAGTPPSKAVIALLQARAGAIERQLRALLSLRHALAGVLEAMSSKADQGDDARLCRVLDLDQARAGRPAVPSRPCRR